MNRRIKSVKGLFGQTIHYENGVKVGESWPGLFKDSYDHYDAKGRRVGYSDPGLFSEHVHRDEHGGYIGETYKGLFGQDVHYGADRRYAGESWNGFIGTTTDLTEDSSDVFDAMDPFGGDDW